MNNEIGGPLLLWREQARLNPLSEMFIADGPPFRPGTEIPITKQNFVFAGAGMGDYICWIPAVQWIAKHCPWVQIKLHVPSSYGFLEFATEIFEDSPTVVVFPAEKWPDTVGPGEFVAGPGVKHNGYFHTQLANGTGGSLVDCGFLYFVNLFPPPANEKYHPELKIKRDLVPEVLRGKRYVAFAGAGASPSREVQGAYWNPIIDHVVKSDMLPVFLGKRQMSEQLKINFPEGCDYHKGLDLRDETSLLEAAEIMRFAECVVGLDGGLIHLAACTTAKIVCAYNMVHPNERRPYRRSGLDRYWTELTLTEKELDCIHCQTNIKRLSGANMHNFRHCLYAKPNPEDHSESVPDTKCIDILFSRNGERWTHAIDEMIKR